MMDILKLAVCVAIIAAVGGVAGWALRGVKHARFVTRVQREFGETVRRYEDTLKADEETFDRLNTRNAELSADVADYQQRLTATDEAWTELARERDTLKGQISDRNEEIARLRKQLSDTVYEITPNIAIDVATDPPVEVQYAVKKPRRKNGKTPVEAARDGAHAAPEVADAIARQQE